MSDLGGFPARGCSTYSSDMSDLSVQSIPGPAMDLAYRFRQAGYGLWLVGGWVRDALLGKAGADLDFATEALPEQTLQILSSWGGSRPWTTGMEFGTVGVQQGSYRLEVTTFRTEHYGRGSRNPSVTYGTDLKTDLSRRDFTVNSLAIELPDGGLIDLFGGVDDLVGRRIRTPLAPEIAFSEDPLRMLRAFRFASVLDFDVDAGLFAAIGKMHGRLSIVSRERVGDELSKLILGGSAPRALEAATDSGLAGEFLPELPGLKLEQDPVHTHKDVFAHTLAVLDNVTAFDRNQPDLALRLAALLHDIGKPRTRQITPRGVTFHHHEAVGAQMAQARLRELRYPSRLVEEVRQLVYLHLRFHTFRLGWTERAVRRYVRDAGPLLHRLNALVRADCTTRNPHKARQLSRRMDDLEERIRVLESKEELSRLRPALNGNEVMERLGLEPGRAVGDALSFLMDLRLDEGEMDKDQAYRRLDEWYRSYGN